MIQHLSIRNYALIDQLEIDFSKGMTIITGETGAGKSILLGALSLLLGSRADSSSLFKNDKKCVIEGAFAVTGMELNYFFEKNDLDQENITLIRREINPDGKSRSFINDTPVNLNVLRELGTNLIEIHSQHETLTLNDSAFQMLIIDSYAKNHEKLQSFRELFNRYGTAISQLDELREQEKKSKLDAGYFQFQFSEIADAKLKEGEQESLEQELGLLNNSEEIKSALAKAVQALNGDESNLIASWSSVLAGVNSLLKVYPKAGELALRLKSVHVEMKDIASEIEGMERDVVYDPGRIEVINDRLDAIYRLQQKHRVNTVGELLAIAGNLEARLEGIHSLDKEIESLEKSVSDLHRQLVKLANEISAVRKSTIPLVEKNILSLLADLGMKHAAFKIELHSLNEGQFKSNGSDRVKFLFSANKGIALRELNKVASGGELSRLMLCIKSMLARLKGLPTIIFDEIDTGISGEIALKVGRILKDMSEERQVIAITHLPQMAGKGDDHLFVYKEVEKGTTYTRIRRLNKNERVEEIAKMLSGDKPTRAALANARELLDV